jgi:tetratricopeptide (TPR) repeat protein
MRFVHALSPQEGVRVGEHLLPALSPPPLSLPGVPPAARLWALDVETTGLGATAGCVFLVGLGEQVGSWVRVVHILAPDFPQEEDLLRTLMRHLEEAQNKDAKAPLHLITYNGDVFDLPMLRARARLYGWRLTLPPSVDLFPLARRLYRHRYPSLRLSHLEGHRLRHVRPDDVPGWMVPQVYREYLHTGDPSLLEPVLAHNAQDLVATLGLAAALAHDLALPPQKADLPLLLGQARVKEAWGEHKEAARLLEHALAAQPSPSLRLTLARRLARLYRQDGDQRSLVRLWRQEASRPEASWEAMEEWAKVLEHRLGDLAGAYAWAHKAWAAAQGACAAQDRLARRVARLARRLAGGRQPA